MLFLCVVWYVHKVILLGDSAVGKSKLVERYLMDEYNPRQLSTFALTLFRKNAKLDDGVEVKVGEEDKEFVGRLYLFTAVLSSC